MKKLSFASGVAAIALAAASIFPAAGVFAKPAADTINNNPVTLKRTVGGVSNPVTNTFTYTITEGSKPDGATVSGAPTSATIVFNGTEAVSSNSVQDTTTLDFSAVEFSKAGDYTWTVAETGSTDTTNYPIDTSHNNYTIQASVRYPVDGSNVPDNTQYIVTMTIKDKDGNKPTEASWVSGAARTYIEVAATTTGNLGDKSECFAYTINIPTGNGVVAGDNFKINSNSTCAETSAASVAAGTPATVYLKHGESLTVGVDNGTNQLPVGAKYTITKTNAGDDYTEKFDGSNASTVTKTTVAVPASGDTAAQEAFNTNNHTDIENNWQANPLTGIVTNFWFYLILLIAGAFGFFFFMRKRQQDDEEQQQA